MTDVSIESVSHVVGCIYEAAYDQERWLDVVTGMRDLLRGSRACIVRFGGDSLDAISTDPDPLKARLALSLPLPSLIIRSFCSQPIALLPLFTTSIAIVHSLLPTTAEPVACSAATLKCIAGCCSP